MSEAIRATAAQLAFISSQAPFPAFVGGYGAGKTYALVLRMLGLVAGGSAVAYYMPTYGLIHDLGIPRLLGILESVFGVRGVKRMVAGRPQVDIPGFGRVLFRSMDTPEAIIGYEVVDSFFDELDTLPADKAAQIWRLALARNRARRLVPVAGIPANTMSVVTTPEGFRFVYEQWGRRRHEAEASGYVLYRGRTAENPALDPSYVETLKATYPANLLAAYLDGEFVNLTAGSVYAEFDRALNATSERIQPGDVLHVGMDFNVGKMSAAVHVLRGDAPHAVQEYTGVVDTPAMVALLKREHPGHNIIIYPDASGASRRSNNASESDIAILKQAGFGVRVNAANPAVKDRVLAVNRMIHNAGERRYRVNPQTCPELVEALEKQAYDKHGEPDKSAGLDHIIDAAGYFIAYRYPVRKILTTLKLGMASR